jgi:dienelactone hydrolase
VELEEFHRVRGQVLSLYRQGRYGEALQAALAAKESFPEKEGEVSFWIACLFCRLGDPEGGLKILQEALERGHWWGERSLLNDPDLEPIRKRPEFKRLLEVCKERQKAAQAQAKPDLLLLPPKRRGEKFPLLIALHWVGGTAQAFVPYWEVAREHGFLLAVPQSSQVESEGGFGWTDRERARKELAAHWEKLKSEKRVDPKRVILAGASQGGALAMELALSGEPIPVLGFIAVVPAIRDPRGLAELAKRSSKARGKRNGHYWGVRSLSFYCRSFLSYAQEAGLRCTLEVVPGLGHDFPDDFPSRLGKALRFLLAGESSHED